MRRGVLDSGLRVCRPRQSGIRPDSGVRGRSGFLGCGQRRDRCGQSFTTIADTSVTMPDSKQVGAMVTRHDRRSTPAAAITPAATGCPSSQKLVGSVTMPVGTAVELSFAVTSHDTTHLAETLFDHPAR